MLPYVKAHRLLLARRVPAVARLKAQGEELDQRLKIAEDILGRTADADAESLPP